MVKYGGGVVRGMRVLGGKISVILVFELSAVFCGKWGKISFSGRGLGFQESQLSGFLLHGVFTAESAKSLS